MKNEQIIKQESGSPSRPLIGSTPCDNGFTFCVEESTIADLLHKPTCDLFKPFVVEINGEKIAVMRLCDCK